MLKMYIKAAIGLLIAIMLYVVYSYITTPRKKLAKINREVTRKTIESDYVNSTIKNDKYNTERKLNEVTTNDTSDTITDWVW